ncbi:right-handed parallel beta-helix repeat-containing protein [Nocardioides donggukensis]|uniref:Right-handed parallel beta-helix repeat-containing protein n=1 Tax=Nocardioides donggukensis TaxID=2774019 RepID=A0A927K3J7_9ACTN|nr:right-handed parallel beta-helix repeat-containing protein [Nocardioides donggukensis]MBD8869392.1 right-handed parallel beta-helix repeat-containing protein [Nocardioides donggukensis]
MHRTGPRVTATLLSLPVLAAWALVVVPGAAVPAAAGTADASTSYHVSPGGSDQADGTSPETAWRTLERASAAVLTPGDRLLLRRGAAFTGRLVLAESGQPGARIRVSTYGVGARPRITGDCVHLEGSFLTLRGVEVHDCTWAGITVRGDDNRIQRSRATGNVAGITVKSGAERTRIRRNELVANNRMDTDTPEPHDDWGAYGIEVKGDHTDIGWNELRDNWASSHDYGTDGAGIEVYGAVGTRIHHNRASDNRTFTELGHARTADTVYAYNAVTSDLPASEFLVTRGGGSRHGPVLGTVARHNTVLLTGRRTEGFWCDGGCGTGVLRLTRNIIVSHGRIGYADGPFASRSNVYWQGSLETPLGRGDRYAAPGFRDAARLDLRLRRHSVAVDRVRRGPEHRDVRGRRVARDGDADGRTRADLGAHER